MKTLPLIPTLLLTIAIVWLPGVAAATPAPPRSPVPLAKVLERSAHIELHTSNAQQTVFLPISPRHRVLRATLHVEFTSSIALKDDRSLLRVGLSDRIIAQLPIRHKNPNGVYDIELPTRLFEPGYVPLTFWVAQHYTFRCEDPSAPELFTQIDVDRSTLTLDVEPIALDPTLAELDDLIDSRLWDDYDLTVVTPSQVDDDRLEPAALVTQGAALRLRFKPLTVHHALVESPSEPRREGRFPGIDATSFGGRDAVLIGTAQELVGLVDDALIRDIDGSFLGIYPQDAAPHRFVLVVSGTDPESLLEAARAFASSSMPLPDTASTRIDAIDELDVQPGTAHHVVHQNRTYRFADLDFRTTTLQGMSAPSIEIDVWVPPDLYALETANVELSLHFAYGAALRRDSTFQVYLNDRFERAIYLRNESGDVFRDYKVQIPLRSFLAYGGGVNRLRF
ncbi:MAG: cellulose biosynthesis cyclic di-GMP-binding regulatory protein BcsB, partial [Acidobacteriota bacterium]